jgi:hypothetical protein
MGKVFHKVLVRRSHVTNDGTAEIKRRGPNRITIRKMIDAERKELTERQSNLYNEKSSPVNIL